MPDTLRIALSQVNPRPGAIRASAGRIRRARAAEAVAMGADLVVTPEFSTAGYSRAFFGRERRTPIASRATEPGA